MMSPSAHSTPSRPPAPPAAESLPIARLRFPSERVLLHRTKLAYVHLRNLLSDAKRDRTGRVDGFVGISMPEEFVLLFVQRGVLVNAVMETSAGAFAVPIADAVARVPHEPEFGEILFHATAPAQLACMFRSAIVTPDEQLPGIDPGDARALLPALRDSRFTGFVEVRLADSANWLLWRDGLIDGMLLADQELMTRPRLEQVAHLFNHSRPRHVRRWTGNPYLPVQAAPELVDAYRALHEAVVGHLRTLGADDPAASMKRARERLLDTHPVLRHFGDVTPGARAVVSDARTLSVAMAAWMTGALRDALHGDDELAVRCIALAGRERRHLLQAAGFTAALPWTISW
ncbi:MAG TPA: hypothetical protein VFG84_07210 [Gemmatimonadaceae bacterium]|nr:hypothetical protein [Gemmatimonadaceae bacterium]